MIKNRHPVSSLPSEVHGKIIPCDHKSKIFPNDTETEYFKDITCAMCRRILRKYPALKDQLK